MMERHFSSQRQRRTLTAMVLGLLLLGSTPLLAADRDMPADTVEHRFVSLKHIAPERARDLLLRLRLGTVSRMPATRALLITADTETLNKAAAVLALVDSPQEYGIARLSSASAARALPSGEEIGAAAGGISIGTFGHPAGRSSNVRALIDVHDGQVWAIAPVFQLQNIRLAVELGPEALKAAKRTQEAGAVATDRPVPVPSYLTQADSALRITPPGGSPKPFSEVPPAMPAQPTRQRLSFGQPDRDAVEPNDVPPPEPEASEPAGTTAANESPVLEPGQVVPPVPERPATSPPEPEAEVAEAEVADVVSAAGTPEPSEAGADAQAYEPADLPNPETVIDLELPERIPVIQLLDLAGKYLNLTYVYDPQKVTGEVTLKLNGDLKGQMKVKDLYLLLESVLQFKNLVMTRHKGNIVKVLPITEVPNADPKLLGPEAAGVETGDLIVTRVFELEHVDTTSAENLLTGMGLTTGGITAIAESGTLIITAYAHRMERIGRLLAMVDQPGEPRKFRFRQLKYTMAKTLTEKVKALAEQLESVTVTIGQTTTPATPAGRLPGESEAAYRTRMARARAAAAAAARARPATAAPKPEETKPGVYLDADERTNRILMIGLSPQLEVVDELVDALDVEQQDLRALKLYRIENVDAETVAQKLQELGIISQLPVSEYGTSRYGTSRSTRLTGTTPRPGESAAAAAARARAAAAAATPEATSAAEVTEEGLVEEPQVVVVEATNSLLVNATAEQHAKIATIIEYVDSETDLSEIRYKIYPLENSSPGHLAEILEGLIQETVEDEEGKIEKVIKREEEITIVPDPNTYSLIVYASKKNQEWIENLVEQLDRRRPQVLIDVTLVEITETDSFNYDLSLIRGWDQLSDTSGVSKVDPNDNMIGTFLRSASGSFTAFYGDRQIQALLTAVQSKNYGRVLAKPKILVNDNEAGMIKTTDTTYIEVTSSVPVTSGGAGAQENLIETSKDYTPYEAGITLDITPHISEGDLLRLDISLIRSDFLPTETPDKPPNTTASEVGTDVTVPDGSTIILGGLLKLNQNKGGKKVPILGDLPLIGGLFRGVNNLDKQSKLYVFVKAEIIRPAERGDQGMDELEAISERNRIAFEKHEREFQEHQDWPGIKPKPVDPVKILEAQ
jgi:type II secretory pathway component GspD/PulD (secretin)